MWRLESVWSPISETAFITFVLEPENMEYVWEIMVSKEKPNHWGGNPNSFSLSLKKWEKELPKFIAFLSDMRNRTN
jgi:hypothetical protein